MNNSLIDNIITNAFSRFCIILKEKYKIGDDNFYRLALDKGDRFTLNPWLITEDDVKMKFGGFLENEFLNKEFPYSVSSEVKVFSNKVQRADLSIYDISNPKPWTTQKDILLRLKAVIEIKYLSYRRPDYEFKYGHIEKDIQKLASLDENILKYLLIIDEGNVIKERQIKSSFSQDGLDKIKVLSNNGFIIKLINSAKYFMEKAITEADKIWDEKGYTNETMRNWLNEDNENFKSSN